MGFDEGQLVLNNDTGTYFPGQILSGRLEFNLEKDKKFRGIYAEVTGKCRIHWTTHHSRRVNDRTEHYTITHESHEEYMNYTIYLIGSKSGEHVLHPGHHVFPFECQIPAHCPSSFHAERGSIRYRVKVTVDRAFKIDQTKEIDFRVMAPIDLNTNPQAKEPVAFEFEQTFCCWCMNAGLSQTLVKLPASGFIPKQIIPIEVACNNTSTVEIDTIKFTIRKLTTLVAEDKPDTYTEDTDIATLKKGPVPGNTTRNWTVEMEVPDFEVHNLATCRFITEEFFFKVEIGTSGCHEDETDSRRIFIGTIPLGSLQYPPNSNFETPNVVPGVTTYPTGPIVNQPMPNVTPYPGNQPYPGGNPPYPGGNPPYPGGNPPYPGGNPPYPGANPPYPGANPPYPGTTPTVGFTVPENTPYPVGPYPGGNSNPPIVTSQHVNSSPYPNRANVGPTPYPPSPNIGGQGLRTGNIGFTNGPKEAMPLLPPGSVPQPSSPYASASAPPPATPDDENKKLTENVPPYPTQ